MDQEELSVVGYGVSEPGGPAVQSCTAKLQETLKISPPPPPVTSQCSPSSATPPPSSNPETEQHKNGYMNETVEPDPDSSLQPVVQQSSHKHKVSDSDIKSWSEPERTNNSATSDDPQEVVENNDDDRIDYVGYKSELQMPDIMRLIQKDLSEPYSVYTYRYFIHNWPNLCFLAMNRGECVGAIVCKLDYHKKIYKRGYIAMLAVDKNFRKRKIGSTLVKKAIDAMIGDDADEVVLETEITNMPALQLYENLGFVRDKRLFRYYLNGVDALRLKLWLR